MIALPFTLTLALSKTCPLGNCGRTIASAVGASVWVMGGITAINLDAPTKSAIDGILTAIPSGFLGASVTGVLLELAGVRVDASCRAS